MLKPEAWMLGNIVSVPAGWTDWRSRRIPNWLTVPGLLLGIAINSMLGGWAGAKNGMLGVGLGLAVLLPFVLVRALGAGDWKLVGALGGWLGPGQLITVLALTIFAAGLMAVALIIWKRRVCHTARNMGRMLTAFLMLRLPGRELTLDDPQAVKVPFGVAVAVAMLFYTLRHGLGHLG